MSSSVFAPEIKDLQKKYGDHSPVISALLFDCIAAAGDDVTSWRFLQR